MWTVSAKEILQENYWWEHKPGQEKKSLVLSFKWFKEYSFFVSKLDGLRQDWFRVPTLNILNTNG